MMFGTVRSAFVRLVLFALVACASATLTLLCLSRSSAQETPPAQAAAPAQPAAPTQAAAAAPAPALRGPDELRKLVAPIALYPDELLAVVLPASTNPLQVVQAQRFLDKRKADQNLQPNADWDPSVLALLNYPEVVEKMNADLDWTQNLGNAVSDQQKDVMDMIQQIRNETYEGGYLKSNDKQTVVQEKETVIIKSADPEYIYVPQYDPQVVYVQNYASYPPPYYAAPYPYYYAPGATFFAGAFMGAAFAYGFNWGGGDNINIGNDVNIGGGNRNRVEHFDSNRFNADRQRGNGRDSMKWNGNKARQKATGGRQRAGAPRAGTLPAQNRGLGATGGRQQGLGQGQTPRAGDRKASGGRNSSMGSYGQGRNAGRASNQGKQSLQNQRSRQPSAGQRPSSQRPSASRNRSNAGAFGGYGGGGNAMRQSNRGRSSFGSSGRPPPRRGGGGGGGGGGRRR